MGKMIQLTASDNFELGAYRADPSGKAKAGIVVIQEIFGVNHHIRSICDRLASEGYSAVAPALFDRQQRGFDVGYSADDAGQAMKMIANPDFAAMLRDTQAAVGELSGSGKVSILGFCLGGSIAFTAAGKLPGLTASVAYYGGGIIRSVDQQPKIPVLMHFGDKDDHIPLATVETIKAKRPDCEIHVYEGAGHGFNCDERASYHKPSADLAWKRSMAFLAKTFAQ